MGSRIQDHLKQTFLAGIFAAVPVAVTVYLVWTIEVNSRFLSQQIFGRAIPFVGILVAIVAIYLCGLLATSLLGRFFIRLVDWLLSHLPGLKTAYGAWKQIALAPGGGREGIYGKVVLVPDETGHMHCLGFTSGHPVPGDPNVHAVFVPGLPNPIQGRLFFVHREKVRYLEISVEEAFKVLLSTGNYVPPALASKRNGEQERVVLE